MVWQGCRARYELRAARVTWGDGSGMQLHWGCMQHGAFGAGAAQPMRAWAAGAATCAHQPLKECGVREAAAGAGGVCSSANCNMWSACQAQCECDTGANRRHVRNSSAPPCK